MPRCTLAELRDKEVINICDGRRLGCVDDIEFEIESGKICSLILAARGGLFAFGCDGEVISWSDIKRIGADIILVDVGEEKPDCCEGVPEKPCPPKPPRRRFFS